MLTTAAAVEVAWNIHGIDTTRQALMTTYSAAPHHGHTELSFSTSLGSAVEGIRYRLRDGQGKTWAGVSGAGGQGVTIAEAEPNDHPASANVWSISGSACIQIDVRRDDGSWKHVGAFQHDGGAHKRVCVVAGAVATPFQMDPI